MPVVQALCESRKHHTTGRIIRLRYMGPVGMISGDVPAVECPAMLVDGIEEQHSQPIKVRHHCSKHSSTLISQAGTREARFHLRILCHYEQDVIDLA
jgi:hypothetical protein